MIQLFVALLSTDGQIDPCFANLLRNFNETFQSLVEKFRIKANIYLSIHLFIHPSNLSIQTIYLSIKVIKRIKAYLSIHPYIHLFIHPYIYLFIHLSIYLSKLSSVLRPKSKGLSLNFILIILKALKYFLIDCELIYGFN